MQEVISGDSISYILDMDIIILRNLRAQVVFQNFIFIRRFENFSNI